MYGCESWTIKKAEYWRIDAFELWCLRGLLRVPWTARRTNQSIQKEISPDYSLGLMLKLKLQYFGHLMWRTESLEKTPMLGKIEGRRRGVYGGWDGWMASPIQWIWVWVDSRRWWRTGKSGMLQSMGLQSQTGLSNWTTATNVNTDIKIFMGLCQRSFAKCRKCFPGRQIILCMHVFVITQSLFFIEV